MNVHFKSLRFPTSIRYKLARNANMDNATAVKAHICPQLISCTVINFWLRVSLYPMTLPSVGQGLRRDTLTLRFTRSGLKACNAQ